MTENNYFVCTLGQAALPGRSRPFTDVHDLIDQQASKVPDLPAVGFYIPDETHSAFRVQTVSFKNVLQGIRVVAGTISSNVSMQKGQTVGLLCNSSPAFLFTWLGLMHMGHPVLLIAPQCSASAIAHLSKTCGANVLFHDEAHEKLAQEAVEFSHRTGDSDMVNQCLPFEEDDEVFRMVHRRTEIVTRSPSISELDVAYLHHTSGTSTGVPKPIPQTHKGGVGVLPSLDGSSSATFTTTPLYHGGVADLFRAWSSSALIWLFPSQHVPITASNIVKCLTASDRASRSNGNPPIRYFSSVPYVLQMMAQDVNGMKLLQGLDIVGVGGAALPPEVGDDLVEKGVNLISRYGSAECGFLMSSHRHYDKDKEWQYLRRSELVSELKFEKQEEGQSELVVLPGWPHVAKSNRDDGSFATSDLFAPHSGISNAWKYHSRADSQLTLITGKKFDPAPIEGSLAASSAIINEVLIFGNGKPYPGAFIFRSEEGKNVSDLDLIEEVAPVVEKLNSQSQSHARIPRNMLIPMVFDSSSLEKSSKGTILRSRAEDKYREQIEDAYNKTTFASKEIKDDELPVAISGIIEAVVSTSQHEDAVLTNETDLFSYGVDSVACVQIRHALTQLVPNDASPLPLTIVEDAGSISRLAEVVIQCRRGQSILQTDQSGQLLRQFIDKFSAFDEKLTPAPSTVSNYGSYNVLLTGPTGLLGTHMLSRLLSDERMTTIYLLVRGASSHAAKERVIKALKSKLLPIPSGFNQRVHVITCKFSETRLGLSDGDYDLLTQKVDKIFHLAWAVNFLVSLRSLGSTHLAGLQSLLDLALASKRQPQFLFCSSVASVSNLLGSGVKIPESIIDELSACGSTGYAQSKLAAEIVCSRYARSTQMKGRVKVVRVGQLSGDTKTGVWNMSEAYPLLLMSSKATGVLPDLKDETLGWLPVDIAARAFIEAAFTDDDLIDGTQRSMNGTVATTNTSSDSKEREEEEAIQVLHLLNTSKTTTFQDLTSSLLKHTQESIEIVPPQQWLEKLARLQQDDGPDNKDHPALKLLPFWNEIYGSSRSRTTVVQESEKKQQQVTMGDGSDSKSVNKTDRSTNNDDGEEGDYEMKLSRKVMPSLNGAIGPLSEEYLLRLWEWIESQS